MFSPDGSNCEQHVPEGVKGIIFKGPTDTYIYYMYSGVLQTYMLASYVEDSFFISKLQAAAKTKEGKFNVKSCICLATVRCNILTVFQLCSKFKIK